MKRNTPNHPKMKALARTLQIPLPYAVGLMEMLWHWTGDFRKQGDIGFYSNEGIAEAVGWTGSPDELIAGLVKEKWLDESKNKSIRLIVHDWPQHCEDSVHTHLARAGEYFADGTKPKLSKLTKEERVESEGTYTSKNVRRKAPKSASKRPAKPSHSQATAKPLKEGGKEGAASPPESPVSHFPETHAEINRPPFAGTGPEVTAAIVKAAQEVDPDISDATIALAVRCTRWRNQKSPHAWRKKVPEYLRSTPPELRGRAGPVIGPVLVRNDKDAEVMRRFNERMTRDLEDKRRREIAQNA